MNKYGFGLDLGGTTCKMGLFSEEGKLLDKWEVPTNSANGGEQILPDLAKAVLAKMSEEAISKEDVIGVGIGVPGPVSEEGVVNKCANLGWGIKDVKVEFSELLGGIPVEVGNDANVAALGECKYGAGVGCDSIVMVTLGTGVGGGIVAHKKIMVGANGAAAEIGHIVVNPEETAICGCGKSGHLEQYASATGIVRVAKLHLEKSEKDSPLKAIEKLEARHIFDEAKNGDELANEIVNDCLGTLGRGLAIIGTIVDPDAFVIGGGVSKAGDIIIERTLPSYKKYVFHACEDTPLLLAKLGNDAGIYGSIGMILD